MIEVALKTMETLIRFLEAAELGSVDDWIGIDITYERPRVKRLWAPLGAGRVYLHEISPCDDPFYHPHPWASAMFIAKGRYTMGLGFGDPLGEPPPFASTLILGAGSFYEMVHPNGWHFVAPVKESAFTVMVTEKPWDHAQTLSPGKPAYATLHPDEKLALWTTFNDLLKGNPSNGAHPARSPIQQG